MYIRTFSCSCLQFDWKVTFWAFFFHFFNTELNDWSTTSSKLWNSRSPQDNVVESRNNKFFEQRLWKYGQKRRRSCRFKDQRTKPSIFETIFTWYYCKCLWSHGSKYHQQDLWKSQKLYLRNGDKNGYCYIVQLLRWKKGFKLVLNSCEGVRVERC